MQCFRDPKVHYLGGVLDANGCIRLRCEPPQVQEFLRLALIRRYTLQNRTREYARAAG